MKKILYILVLLMLSINFACTDLDETIYDKIPEKEFGLTEQQVNSIIAPVYKALKEIFPSNLMSLNECSGDMAIVPTRVGGDWWDGGQYMAMRTHAWTPETNLIVEAYKKCINGITACNTIYTTISDNPIVPNKEKVLAEIRGVRAFWYYMLIDTYGNVPIVTDSRDLSLPKTTPRKEAFDFVTRELTQIIDLLDEEVNLKTYGHFTKGAAYAVLAKMYLNSEVWTGIPQWQKAADACDSIMALGYILEPDWKTNFITDNEKSNEIIFPAIFREGEDGNSLHKRTLHYLTPSAWGINIGSWNGISANPDYVKEFDTINDKRFRWTFYVGAITDPQTGKTLMTAHNRLLIHTTDIPQLEPYREGIWGSANQESGARCNKWEFKRGVSSDLGNDFAIFRLADVYLMKAEALVRLGINNGEATELVNEIRKRGFDDASFLKSAVTLDDVYKERRFELAWESYSRQDQIRFGKFLQPGFLKPNATPAHRLLFPIPQEALRENKNLDQNTGYQ